MPRALHTVMVAASVLGSVSGCGGPARPGEPAGAVSLTLEPGSPLDDAPRVVRAHVDGLSVEPGALALFAGELTSYATDKLRSGEVATTLDSRRIPALSFRSPDGALTIAPLALLPPGEAVNVTALGVGVLGTLVATATLPAYLVRSVFPVAGGGARRWVFCGTPTTMAEHEVVLEPTGEVVRLRPGADGRGTASDRCVHMEAAAGSGDPGPSLPPIDAFGTTFEPSSGSFEPTDAAAIPLACTPAELRFGPGCATPEDDRVVVRTPTAPLLWALSVGQQSVVDATRGGQSLVVKGLLPGRENLVQGSVTDATGRETPIDAVVSAAPSRPHIVVNEVLANALGPEPAQEWVELVNDGSTAVSLGGFRFGDAGADLELPGATLAPGQLALVVTPAFTAAAAPDVPPVPGTLLLRLDRLGQSGLSNAGEMVVLRDPDGGIVSRFPAVAAGKAGVSIARAHPWDPDEERAAFGPSAAPGASPGAVNQLAQ